MISNIFDFFRILLNDSEQTWFSLFRDCWIERTCSWRFDGLRNWASIPSSINFSIESGENANSQSFTRDFMPFSVENITLVLNNVDSYSAPTHWELRMSKFKLDKKRALDQSTLFLVRAFFFSMRRSIWNEKTRLFEIEIFEIFYFKIAIFDLKNDV